MRPILAAFILLSIPACERGEIVPRNGTTTSPAGTTGPDDPPGECTPPPTPIATASETTQCECDPGNAKGCAIGLTCVELEPGEHRCLAPMFGQSPLSKEGGYITQCAFAGETRSPVFPMGAGQPFCSACVRCEEPNKGTLICQ